MKIVCQPKILFTMQWVLERQYACGKPNHSTMSKKAKRISVERSNNDWPTRPLVISTPPNESPKVLARTLRRKKRSISQHTAESMIHSFFQRPERVIFEPHQLSKPWDALVRELQRVKLLIFPRLSKLWMTVMRTVINKETPRSGARAH